MASDIFVLWPETPMFFLHWSSGIMYVDLFRAIHDMHPPCDIQQHLHLTDYLRSGSVVVLLLCCCLSAESKNLRVDRLIPQRIEGPRQLDLLHAALRALWWSRGDTRMSCWITSHMLGIRSASEHIEDLRGYKDEAG